MKIYSGCGNTFLIGEYKNDLTVDEVLKRLENIDVDGLMLVEKEPLTMHLYNKDGSIASMCGNGIRCFIHYCYDQNYLLSDENIVKTLSGNIYTKILDKTNFLVYVGMNEASFTYTDNKEYLEEEMCINSHLYKISLVNTGVWHGVIIPNSFNDALIDAKDIREYGRFKENLNVDLVSIDKIKNIIYVKTYERGVGFTKACGTGVMATYIVLKKLGIINSSSIEIYTDGGKILTGIDKKPFIIGESKYICDK